MRSRPFPKSTTAVALYTFVLVGCDVPEDIDETSAELVSTDPLSAAALVPHLTDPTALEPSTITSTQLVFASMPPAAQTALQNPGSAGDLSRLFMKWNVHCTFSSAQSFTFSWIDAGGGTHNESYPGSIGLATSWATGALNVAGQEWVTACLASRTRAAGTSQHNISMRNSSVVTTSAAEKATYKKQEGAFYGNIFNASDPDAYGCPGAAINSALIVGRKCAGTLECLPGIYYAGNCGGGTTGACASYSNGTTYYGHCYSDTSRTGPVYTRVFTIYLQ